MNGELAGGDGVAQGVEQTLRLLGELRRGFGGEAQLLVSGSCFPLGLLGQSRYSYVFDPQPGEHLPFEGSSRTRV